MVMVMVMMVMMAPPTIDPLIKIVMMVILFSDHLTYPSDQAGRFVGMSSPPAARRNHDKIDFWPVLKTEMEKYE